VLAAEPHLLLDNGGDLFVRYLDQPYERLLGGTEETTSGRMRLALLRHEIAKPVLVINDSPIKQFAENKHSVGQSVVESFLRITNRATNGRRVTVFGYGACGKGVALNFRNNHAIVSVVEIDPVARLEALFDGFTVPDRDEALASAQIIITVTGAQRVITARDLAFLADDVVLANAGHFPLEIDMADLVADPSVEGHSGDEGITTVRLADGRRIHLLGEGHMVNQARSLEAVANGSVGRESCVVPVPRAIDERVARSYVELAQGSAPRS
jgi:adenosylhomocysteinase